MKKKFYKVLQDTFIWEKGAIITNSANEGKGYMVVDEIFVKDHAKNEYISDVTIENSPEWFERVYEVNLLTKTVYKAKDEAKRLIEENYK